MQNAALPKLRPELFWDSDFEKIDYVNNYRYIIERVLDRGTLDEWFEIKRYYGLEKIKEASVQARWLKDKVLNFCSIYFEIPINQFRCYNTPHFQQRLWRL